MKKHVLAAALCLSACASAFAQSDAADAGHYVLAAGGQTNANLDCTGFQRCSQNDLGGKLVFGWRVNDGLAVEAGYYALGKSSATSGGDPRVDLTADAVVAVAAFTGTFAPGWSGVARLGVASVNTRSDVRFLGVSASESERTVQPTFGLALRYAATSRLSVEVAWDTARGEIAGQKSTLTLASLGLSLAF